LLIFYITIRRFGKLVSGGRRYIPKNQIALQRGFQVQVFNIKIAGAKQIAFRGIQLETRSAPETASEVICANGIRFITKVAAYGEAVPLSMWA